MKVKDHSLRSNSSTELSGYHGIPPVRSQIVKHTFASGCENATLERIGSFDYDKWDKYDAGTNCAIRNFHINCFYSHCYLSLIRYRMHENGLERGAES